MYRDPVHDFGFFRFDPSKVVDTPLVEVELNPAGAVSQESVLIMGNAAGEKLTYVESTIGRVDRNYEEGYDLNTFFISASDITVGGSSGGPMMNEKGQAVGMVSMGINETNSSFYFPLDRVTRAIKLYQSGKTITRGTIQVAFFYKSYTDLERLKVSPAVIKEVKDSFPEGDGMLLVSRNVPKGPGQIAGIKNGDVLYKIDGALIPDFVMLAEVLDESIGKELSIVIIRSGEEIVLKTVVVDLEESAPSEMIEISRGVVSSIDYLLALQCNLPIEGVIVSQSGYMFKQSDIDEFNVILEIGEDKIVDLASFEDAMKKHDSGSLVRVKYFFVGDPVQKQVGELIVDKRWYPFRKYRILVVLSSCAYQCARLRYSQ